VSSPLFQKKLVKYSIIYTHTYYNQPNVPFIYKKKQLWFLLTMSRCLSIHGSSTKIALMLVRQASLSRTRRSRDHHIALTDKCQEVVILMKIYSTFCNLFCKLLRKKLRDN